MTGRPVYDLRYHPAFKDDLQRLVDGSRGNKSSREHRLLTRSLRTLNELRAGQPSTHPLEYLSNYPDISDCQTSYVGGDIDAKPSHRIVWRQLPPSRPGGLPVREILALGERQYGAAYHLAGSRLGRPVGVTLDELDSVPEPIKTPPEPAQPQGASTRPKTAQAQTTGQTMKQSPSRDVIAERRRKHPELFTDDGEAADQGARARGWLDVNSDPSLTWQPAPADTVPLPRPCHPSRVVGAFSFSPVHAVAPGHGAEPAKPSPG